MKIYRNKRDRNVIGIKFETAYGYPMVLVCVTGEYPAVDFKFTHRDKEHDFNSDEEFEKDYDATLESILKELLGITNGTERFWVRVIDFESCTVRVAPANDGDRRDAKAADLESTIKRLGGLASSVARHVA